MYNAKRVTALENSQKNPEQQKQHYETTTVFNNNFTKSVVNLAVQIVVNVFTQRVKSKLQGFII